LNIPELVKPGKESFDTRPKTVDAWLSELPLGDTGECARRIYHALKEINRLDISRSARLHVLTLLTDPAFEIFSTLKRHYTNQTLPMSEKNRKIANLAIALNAEIATGYKIIVEQTWTKELSLFNRKSTAAVIHRALYYMSNMLLTAYQIYIDHPPNAWVHIHQMYLYAEENKLHNIIIKNKDTHKKLPRCSISDLYKQIVLLALLSPYRLRQPVIEKVYESLLKWSQQCSVLSAEHYDAQAQQVKIRLNSDHTPGYYNDSDSTNRVHARVLDTGALVQTLGEQIINQQYLNGAKEIDGIPDDVIKLIIQTWSGQSKRAFARTAANNTLTITVGLSATHDLIRELVRLNPELETTGFCEEATAAIFDMELGLEEISALQDPDLNASASFEKPLIFGANSVEEFASDVWSSDFGSKTIGYDYNLKLWYEQKEKEIKKGELKYEPYNCNNVNESAGGYCLIGYLEAATVTPKIQVGELIGVRDTITSEGNNIGVGVVRRLKNHGKNLELGIQKLAPCAQSASICRYVNDPELEHYVRALVLPPLKSLDRPVTLLAHDTFKVNDQLIINKHGYKTHIKLTKLVESTGIYRQFEYSVVKVIGFGSQALKSKDDSEFDKVWTLI
jgi:hypothetical protein